MADMTSPIPGDDEMISEGSEEGGITAWSQTALRELEAEVEVERTKRHQEQEAASATGGKEPSPN